MQRNIIDRLVSIVSPSAGLRRANARFYMNEQNRLMKKHEEKVRKYEAAAMGRRTGGWIANGTSVNQENLGVLQILRNRSRDLQQNNYWARRAVKVISNHTVGTGILPNFIGKNKSQRKQAKMLFDKWQQKKYCDFDQQHNFYGLQKLVMKTLAVSGEVIVRKRRIDNGPGVVPIQLQVQEPDVIDTSRDGIFLEGGNFIVQGVEFNTLGKRVAYWLFDYHPGDLNIMYTNYLSKRIPASDVLHIIEVLRPGQVRGVPMGISAFIRLKDFDDYEDAQIIRQKVAACYSAFVTSMEQKSALGIGTTGTKTAAAERAERLEPGMIEYLNPGETVDFGKPPGSPDTGFTKSVLLGISIAWDITYEALTGDLSGSNFSSSRMGWLEMARNVTDWQSQIMIPSFCEPIFEWFDDAAQISALIQPGTVCGWTAPRREMFDPYKEMQAIVLAIQAGMTSWSEAARELGWDPQELLELVLADQQLMDKMGIMFTSDPRAALKLPPEGAGSSDNKGQEGDGNQANTAPKKNEGGGVQK